MRLRTKILGSFLGIVVLALLALQTPILKRVRGAAWDSWVGVVGQVGWVGDFEIADDTAGQLATLQSENARLRSELRRFTRVERQLGASVFSGFRQIPATVGVRPIDTYQAQYVLHKGVDDGVVTGAPVVVNGSMLVGFVSELSARSSVVTLLTNPHNTLPVEVAGDDPQDTPARGLAQGSHFTSILLSTVPRDKELVSGMHVVTASQEGVVPHGLLVGNVGSVVSAERDAYQSAVIDVPYDSESLEAVTILVPVASRP